MGLNHKIINSHAGAPSQKFSIREGRDSRSVALTFIYPIILFSHLLYLLYGYSAIINPAAHRQHFNKGNL